MHPFNWDVTRLEKELRRFLGKQFRLKTKDEHIYQGKFVRWEFSGVKNKDLKLYFEWLCIQVAIGYGPSKIIRWDTINRGSDFLSMEWRFYYRQRSRDEKTGKEPRPSRLKVKESFFTARHEECWFFDEDDPQFLVKVDGKMCLRPKVLQFPVPQSKAG